MYALERALIDLDLDLLRVIAMVVRSIRFYAKRGMNVTLEPPEDAILEVQMRSHFLIRSLFLIFVELVEASYDSGIELNVEIKIEKNDKARIILEKGAALNPKNAILFNNLGIACLRLGDKEKAREAFEKALELNPKFKKAEINLKSVD